MCMMHKIVQNSQRKDVDSDGIQQKYLNSLVKALQNCHIRMCYLTAHYG